MKMLAVLCCCLTFGAGMQAAVAADSKPLPAKQAEGHAVFQRWCEPCHGRDTKLAGTAGLTMKYKGKIPAALEDRKDLTVAAVKTFVRQGSGSMAPFRKTEVSEADLDALAAYLTAKRPR